MHLEEIYNYFDKNLPKTVDYANLKDTAEHLCIGFTKFQESEEDFEVQGCYSRKSDEKASWNKQQGNELYKAKRFEEAILAYFKSLKLVSDSGNKMEFIFTIWSNITAVYIEMQRHDLAEYAIKQLLKYNLPEKLKSRALQRQKKLPCIRKEPEQSKICENLIEVRSSPTGGGRGVFALKDIEPGTLILVESSSITLPLPEADIYNKFCYKCLDNLVLPIGCNLCSQVLYCSESCRKVSWEETHYCECRFMTFLLNATIPKFQASLCHISYMSLVRSFHTSLEAERIKSVYHDVALLDKVLLRKLVPYALTIATMEKNRLNSDFVVDFIEHACRHQFNSFMIQNTNKPAIGISMFPQLALCNHSCSPNVTTYFSKNGVYLYSLNTISKDGEIFMSYGPHFSVQNRLKRTEVLKTRYGFDCQCEACRLKGTPG